MATPGEPGPHSWQGAKVRSKSVSLWLRDFALTRRDCQPFPRISDFTLHFFQSYMETAP
jgi:hypothetical protein